MNKGIEEAKRYIDNAKEILSTKAGKDNNHYSDKKYVRMAGNTAYNGVLEALDVIVPSLPKRKRKSVEYYQMELAKKDKKLLVLYNDTYQILHLSLGYDGNLNVAVVKAGMEAAEELIEKVGRFIS